jgi:hypothetical protein
MGSHGAIAGDSWIGAVPADGRRPPAVRSDQSHCRVAQPSYVRDGVNGAFWRGRGAGYASDGDLASECLTFYRRPEGGACSTGFGEAG